MFDPIRPRPIIPSCTRQSSLEERCFDRIRSGRMNAGLLEEIHELSIVPCDLGDSLLARRLLGPPGDQRIPEIGPADREADEARHLCRDPEPVPHFAIVLAAAENDATDPVTTAGPRRRDDRLAIFAAIEAFDFPQIRFDAGGLELANGLDHQAGPE